MVVEGVGVLLVATAVAEVLLAGLEPLMPPIPRGRGAGGEGGVREGESERVGRGVFEKGGRGRGQREWKRGE